MNSPPTKRNARGKAGVVETEKQGGVDPTTFRVVIDGARRGMPWGLEHASLASAEAEAARVRKIGMAARVERVERAEFGTSRRAFLVAMFMCGAVKSDAVVTRIVADVNADSST